MVSHGGGGHSNVNFTNEAYLVKPSTKGEGGKKSPKNGPHGLCMTPNVIALNFTNILVRTVVKLYCLNLHYLMTPYTY